MRCTRAHTHPPPLPGRAAGRLWSVSLHVKQHEQARLQPSSGACAHLHRAPAPQMGETGGEEGPHETSALVRHPNSKPAAGCGSRSPSPAAHRRALAGPANQQVTRAPCQLSFPVGK